MAGDFDLTGRVAIVTGGNGGIGLGMAKALARAGCAVSIWGRNARRTAPRSPSSANVERAGRGADERRHRSRSNRGRFCRRRFKLSAGSMAAFANAGIGASGQQAFVDRPEDEWRRMFATNLDGVFHVFQVALRHMIKRAEGGDRFGRARRRRRASCRCSACRAASTTPRPRRRSTSWFARSRSSTRATASPLIRSCRAGSRPT